MAARAKEHCARSTHNKQATTSPDTGPGEHTRPRAGGAMTAPWPTRWPRREHTRPRAGGTPEKWQASPSACPPAPDTPRSDTKLGPRHNPCGRYPEGRRKAKAPTPGTPHP
ncbi:hypothetical protein GCM10022402_42350 [Salinactinospora qingdaonensis]|uniref:Uncharacterized protein n=1 Tax=Salinactinospora qingdaonensis TaxID=702744 RepID=A0ABP7GBK3_9ACTN